MLLDTHHGTAIGTEAKPSRRWFRLKFADGRIDGTDWSSEQTAQACIDWYKANLPHAPYTTASIVELTHEQHAQSLLNAITRTIGPRHADIFLGGK